MKKSLVTTGVLIGAAGVLAGCMSGLERPAPIPSETASFDVSQHEADLEQLAEDFGLDEPPDVEIVQLTNPEEQVALIATCMTDLGHPPDESGGYDTGGVALQENEAVATALYTCMARYPVEPRFLEPLTADQVSMVYTHIRDEMIPCYTENGWRIDPASLPSEGVFIDTYETNRWAPNPPPASLTDADIYRISMDCPAAPPSDVLYATSGGS